MREETESGNGRRWIYIFRDLAAVVQLLNFGILIVGGIFSYYNLVGLVELGRQERIELKEAVVQFGKDLSLHLQESGRQDEKIEIMRQRMDSCCPFGRR